MRVGPDTESDARVVPHEVSREICHRRFAEAENALAALRGGQGWFFLAIGDCPRHSLNRATFRHRDLPVRTAVYPGTFPSFSKGVWQHVARWLFTPLGGDWHQRAGASGDKVDVRLLKIALAKPRG